MSHGEIDRLAVDRSGPDLSALDPSGLERLVGAIMRAAQPELARRASSSLQSPLTLLARWIRPALSAAAVLTLAAGSILATRGLAPEDASSADPPAGVAEALRVPAAVTAWLEAGRTPTVEELLVSLEGANP